MARRSKLIPVVVACGVAGAVSAQESDAPDLSFLEYLGSWEDGDDEWIVVAEMADFERSKMEPVAGIETVTAPGFATGTGSATGTGTARSTGEESAMSARSDSDSDSESDSATRPESEILADTEAPEGIDGDSEHAELSDEREETHAE